MVFDLTPEIHISMNLILMIIQFHNLQIACRTEMEARAKELIEMLASPHILPLAIKYAGKLGRLHLAEKLGELLPQFQEQVSNIYFIFSFQQI